MKQFLTFDKSLLLLILIIIIGVMLRFYKLDWGDGLYTHPDEYHIVGSVNQLSFPHQMHPHFFSYGTVSIYLIYFTKELLIFLNSQLSTLNLFIIGRFYSAFFSTLTIFVIYKLSKIFLPKSYALFAAFLTAITPGLIQQAHFTTPESALTFFIFGSLLFLFYFLKSKSIRYLIFCSIFFGLSLGVKISALVFLLPLIGGVILSLCHSRESGNSESRLRIKSAMTKKEHIMTILKFLSLTLASTITIVGTLVIVAPFIFLDFPAFWSNLNYEGSLAAGNIPVFYTRQFIDTIPVVFQFEKIFPYALGPTLLILGILGFFTSFLHLGWWPASQRGEPKGSSEVNHRGIYFVLLLSFLSLFIPSAFLFAKWTRFIAPTFPFFAIFSAIFLWEICKQWRRISYGLTGMLIIVTSLWTCAFFSIYMHQDIRITASNWLASKLPQPSTILVEGGNTIDLPLSGNFQRISLDFYTLEDDVMTREKIIDALSQSDYFFVQSRRVFLNHQRTRKQFPKTAHFYDMLFAGKLGFTQIKEFHSYPTLSFGNISIEFPDEHAEETWSVFDHPVIRVFKKNKILSTETYAKIFE